MHVPAKNFCMDGQIWRARKQNINNFTIRWYLVFLIFVIRGLRRSEQATFTAGNMFVTLDSNVRNAHSTSNCVRNAHSTPLIDDNVTDVCYYTTY